MTGQTRQPAPDYTKPALVFLFVNLLWIFGVVWATLGLAPVLLGAIALNHAITLLDRRLARKG
ncbi:histidinol phosphate aminotransferase [Salipiger sp. P9]|uniref:histidinol phosphate aminotransferase n=1 Tax=Salipiger pentaromativorans TaxID=2943193 RepID=UPI0021588599|nr:histidinol phosphate aminotransferase [Salipiger pentaromativorans]MCR8549904.1 histidinol phosphate aminotransferase [Salipiger pentaromativorans]